jgi:carboxymethylenebutenolidase
MSAIEIQTADGPARGYVAAPPDDAATPRLGLFGDLDGSIPSDDVEVLRQSLDGVRTNHEIVRYPDADHGFHCDARPMFRQAASEDAFARTVRWIGDHLR